MKDIFSKENIVTFCWVVIACCVAVFIVGPLLRAGANRFRRRHHGPGRGVWRGGVGPTITTVPPPGVSNAPATS